MSQMWCIRIFLCVSTAVISGCTSMTSSVGLPSFASGSGLACQSDLGAYSLPRQLIKVSVKGGEDGENFGLEVNEGDYVADPNHIYCLDFLASTVADERIGVKRNNKNRLLLERVYTKSIDKTRENARKLVQASADFIAFNRAQRFGRAAGLGQSLVASGIVREFNFDPFVRPDVQKVNSALRPFGYCIYLQRTNDALVPDWFENVCESEQVSNWKPYKTDITYKGDPDYAPIVDDRPIANDLRDDGIFYRPELTHILIIMKQDQPGISGAPWHRAGSMRLSLPNAAPPFLLRVERSVFVDAETDVKFKNGVMQNVAVDKKSELNAVSEFAVEVVQVVQKIPVVALAIFDNRVDNQLALIEANEKLINTLQEYNQARGIAAVDRRSLAPGADRQIFRGYYEPVERSAAGTDPISTCLLENPAIRDEPDPEATCRRIVEGNL